MPAAHTLSGDSGLLLFIRYVDKELEVCDGLKEVTELLSGLSSFVKVDKLTKVLSGGRIGIDCVVCSSQAVDVWRKQATIEYENDIPTATIEVCVCGVCVYVCVCVCVCVVCVRLCVRLYVC